MARILVIDDDESIRGMLEAVLSFAEHEVAIATTGDDALRLLRAQPFDLLLFDPQTPGVCGYELLMLLDEVPERGAIPVVVMSSEPEPADAGWQVGIPLHAGELLDTIDGALAHARRAAGTPAPR